MNCASARCIRAASDLSTVNLAPADLPKHGSRYDLDFHLLEGHAEQCFLAMQEFLHASHPYQDDEDEDENAR